jgi:hypothetical protein
MKQGERSLMVDRNGVSLTEWTMEQVFAGERLYSALQTELDGAIYTAVVDTTGANLLPVHEIAGIVAHGLLEAAMRQIMATKMPCSLTEFESAARFVYASCHALEETHGDARRQ